MRLHLRDVANVFGEDAIAEAGREALDLRFDLGGDVAVVARGANDPRQMVFRPRVALDPYTTGINGVYLCSAATPPGAGAHGMCGYNAAESALRRLGQPAGASPARAGETAVVSGR